MTDDSWLKVWIGPIFKSVLCLRGASDAGCQVSIAIVSKWFPCPIKWRVLPPSPHQGANIPITSNPEWWCDDPTPHTDLNLLVVVRSAPSAARGIHTGIDRFRFHGFQGFHAFQTVFRMYLFDLKKDCRAPWHNAKASWASRKRGRYHWNNHVMSRTLRVVPEWDECNESLTSGNMSVKTSAFLRGISEKPNCVCHL